MLKKIATENLLLLSPVNKVLLPQVLYRSLFSLT